MRTVTEVAFLVDGVNQRQVVVLSITVVVVGDSHVLERCAETVKHPTEVIALATGADHLSKVARWNKHVLQLMQISVLTSHVCIDNLVTEDVGRILVLVIGSTGDNLEVTVGAARRDTVARHLLGCEVNHHLACSVHHHVDTLVVELCPIVVVLR